jgi:hypothetical protein
MREECDMTFDCHSKIILGNSWLENHILGTAGVIVF